MFEIILLPDAEAAFSKLDRAVQTRIGQKKDISTADMKSDVNTDMNTINRQVFSLADMAEEKIIFCLP